MAAASDDPFDLARFERAQDDSFQTALAEISAGRKRSHWMWFVFPQIRGLGHSETATFYAIGSADEARTYLSHPILGERLRNCLAVLNALTPHRSATQIFGDLDAMKLCSCLTLFDAVAPHEPLFAQALDSYFDGQRDRRTLDILASRSGS